MRSRLSPRSLVPRDRYDARLPRSSPSLSRVLAFAAWVISVYITVSVILINIGGVGSPIPSGDDPRSQLGNTGLEILQWLNDGDDETIPNYYHFRLYLNRICAVNPTKQRGNGQCYNSGILGLFHFSQYFPDAFTRSQKGYDAVVGRVDLFTPFVCWALGAVASSILIFVLPATFLADSAGGSSRWMVNQRSCGALLTLCAAVFHTGGSVSYTITLARLRHWMEYVPQVSHVWQGQAPIAMTWAGSVLLIVIALALQNDVAIARRIWRTSLQRRSVGLYDRHTFHLAEEEPAGAWGMWEGMWLYGLHWWLDYPLLRESVELVSWIRRRRRSSGSLSKHLEDGDALVMTKDDFEAERKMG